MQGQVIRPFGPTLYRNRISEQLRTEVLEKSAASADDAAGNLAGNIIKQSFITLSDACANELQSIIVDYVTQCTNGGFFKPPGRLAGVNFEKLWVNHQGPGEWNPPHIHSGDFSLVGYCQVPPELKDEWKHPNQQGQDPVAGKIQWNYGQWAPYNVSMFGPVSPEEGDIYVFPAWLLHYVFPFNADVVRVSFSTNCFLKYTGGPDQN